MESASIILIQETKKMAEDSLATLKIFWPKGEGLATNAFGAFGGLLCWSDDEKFAMHSAIEKKKLAIHQIRKQRNKRNVLDREHLWPDHPCSER